MPNNSEQMMSLIQQYRIAPVNSIQGFNTILNARAKASPDMETLLTMSGYKWDKAQGVYKSDRGYQTIISFPNNVFIWVMGQLAKILKNPEKLKLWVTGRGSEFLDKFKVASDIADPIDIGAATSRPEPPSSEDKVGNILKKVTPGSHMKSDDIIDLYKLAKETGNEKLMKLVKTLQVSESIIKKSKLKKIIQEIVKGIYKEMDEDITNEQSVTGAVSPISAPKVFSKKKVKETNIISPAEEKAMDINGAKNVANSIYGSVYLVRPYSKSLDGKTEFFEVKLQSAAGPKKYIYKEKKSGEWFYSVGYGAESKWELFVPSAVNEITTTASIAVPSVPTWVSRRGGSRKGIEGSAKLGYDLTPIGKKEMDRMGDKL